MENKGLWPTYNTVYKTSMFIYSALYLCKIAWYICFIALYLNLCETAALAHVARLGGFRTGGFRMQLSDLSD